MLRDNLEQLQSKFTSMPSQTHDKVESQTHQKLQSQHTTASTDAAAATEYNRWPHRWDATETLRWFGTTFPFSDLYIDRFAELDIDAEALQNLSDAELREELQVRDLDLPRDRYCRVAGSVDKAACSCSCWATSLTTILLDWAGASDRQRNPSTPNS